MRLKLLFLLAIVAATMAAAVFADERPGAASSERPAAVPLVYSHSQRCPVGPAEGALRPCVCDHEGKNCRVILQPDRLQQGTSPWCQCPLREARDGR